MLAITTMFLQGCKKNFSEEIYTPSVKPVIPDFATLVNASVKGFITDENGNAVENASIKGGGVTVTTDAYGYFKINTASFAKSAGFIQASKAGYFTGYRTFLPVAGKETFIRLQLIPKTAIATLDASAGGTVSITSGATITLPANAVVIASNNNPYSGTVNIAAHWLDPSDMRTTSLTMPGDLTGVDSAGHLNVLQTFGMLAVELTGSNGELLQVAAGKKAALHFPIPSSLTGAAPVSIPLWYFDESKGVWKQEGRAVKNGNSYDGEVGHFSFWNCDIGYSPISFTVQIVDSELHPLANVEISITGSEFSSFNHGCTDSSGFIYGRVPANSNLVIAVNIIGPCNQKVDAITINTVNEPIDLGTLKVDMREYGAVLQGNVIKCNGSPVTDGYVMVTGLGNNSIIEIKNGSFSVAGSFCPGASANFIAFDRETSLRSIVQAHSLVSGINNIGELEACTASIAENNIHIEFTGPINPITYTLPQYLFGGNFYVANDSTSINTIDLLNGSQQVLQFSFTGPAAPGTYPLSNNSITLNGQVIIYYAPVSVTVTNYGLVGQFITGNFGGLANIGENVYVNFNVQRDQ